MKKGFFSIFFAMAFLATATAQDKPVKFTVQVSTDSILMGNYFEVKFTLENANGQNFEAPDFNDHFKVVSGPNHSTSMSIVNGNMTQSMTITYYLEPKDVGAFYILPASVQAGDKTLETSPMEVLVVPNPDGIRQNQPRRMDGFQFNWGDMPDMNFDFSFPDFRNLMPPLPPAEEAPKEAPKKKKKTIRI
jgi:hypothetical protein